MGEKEILDKLLGKLQSVPRSEEDIVYILSRVRKVLEINNHPEKYSVLNFYCNLALHSKIDRPPKKISDMLTRVHTGNDYSKSIIGFEDFHKQLREFLTEHNLPNFYLKATVTDVQRFNRLLNAIYSYTPIITEVVAKYQTNIDENGMISGSPIE